MQRGSIKLNDVTGIELTPGNGGEKSKGNGKHKDENGKIIECCCDECDYLLCCIEDCDNGLQGKAFGTSKPVPYNVLFKPTTKPKFNL